MYNEVDFPHIMILPHASAHPEHLLVSENAHPVLHQGIHMYNSFEIVLGILILSVILAGMFRIANRISSKIFSA